MGTLGGIPLDVGDVLAKKYRLERLVGEGVTGVVVAARHLQLDRLVAIKFLRTALASDEIRLRFEREARAIGRIESDHVVLVLDAGALDDGSPYMVMEYLEGRDLAKTLKEDGRLPIEDAVDCMLQVCEALAGAHAQGIVHRDLKPANLFLTRRADGGPHMKVVDFGISKITAPALLDGGPRDMTSAFTVLGSPRYMAPEQLRDSKDVDARADLWSVGAVLFQLVTGKPAFDAAHDVTVSLAVVTKEAPLLRTLVPDAPPELELIVEKCLCKDRNARFQTAAELADALRPLASDHTRASLARLYEAKQKPNLDIALRVSSEGERVDAEAVNAAASVQSGLTVPLHPPTTPRRPLGAAASSSGPPSAGPPSSGDPKAAFSRALRRSPTATTKMAVVAAGLLLVLLAFGVFTLLKMAAQSMGVLPSAAGEPSYPASPASPWLASSANGRGAGPMQDGPSQVVTVTLDAGRPPP